MSIIVKILGTADLLAAVFFWLYAFFGAIPGSIILAFGFYLLIKGIVFLAFKDFASILDVICAVIFFLAVSIVIPNFIVILAVLYLIQKGVFSWMS